MLQHADEPLRRVLVAVDLSAASDQLVRRALLLPLSADATIEALFVVPAQLPLKRRVAVARAADEALARLAPPGAPLIVSTATGDPAVEIIRRSREVDADLIIVGRGRKRMRSTPNQVVRKGDVPVLVVAEPSPTTRPYFRPMVAVDLSDTSQRVAALALRMVGAEASRRAALIHAYHVPFEEWLGRDGVAPQIRAAAQEGLSRLQRGFGAESAQWRPVLRRGDPRVEIVMEALRRHSDVIVVGTHGRSGLARALVGSVAEWLLSNAPCDVLITPPMRYSFELPLPELGAR